eukprot:jgi/Botrbrau1/6623/Bobra.104_2s0010.1
MFFKLATNCHVHLLWICPTKGSTVEVHGYLNRTEDHQCRITRLTWDNQCCNYWCAGIWSHPRE